MNRNKRINIHILSLEKLFSLEFTIEDSLIKFFIEFDISCNLTQLRLQCANTLSVFYPRLGNNFGVGSFMDSNGCDIDHTIPIFEIYEDDINLFTYLLDKTEKSEFKISQYVHLKQSVAGSEANKNIRILKLLAARSKKRPLTKTDESSAVFPIVEQDSLDFTSNSFEIPGAPSRSCLQFVGDLETSILMDIDTDYRPSKQSKIGSSDEVQNNFNNDITLDMIDIQDFCDVPDKAPFNKLPAIKEPPSEKREAKGKDKTTNSKLAIESISQKAKEGQQSTSAVTKSSETSAINSGIKDVQSDHLSPLCNLQAAEKSNLNKKPNNLSKVIDKDQPSKTSNSTSSATAPKSQGLPYIKSKADSDSESESDSETESGSDSDSTSRSDSDSSTKFNGPSLLDISNPVSSKTSQPTKAENIQSLSTSSRYSLRSRDKAQAPTTNSTTPVKNQTEVVHQKALNSKEFKSPATPTKSESESESESESDSSSSSEESESEGQSPLIATKNKALTGKSATPVKKPITAVNQSTLNSSDSKLPFVQNKAKLVQKDSDSESDSSSGSEESGSESESEPDTQSQLISQKDQISTIKPTTPAKSQPVATNKKELNSKESELPAASSKSKQVEQGSETESNSDSSSGSDDSEEESESGAQSLLIASKNQASIPKTAAPVTEQRTLDSKESKLTSIPNQTRKIQKSSETESESSSGTEDSEYEQELKLDVQSLASTQPVSASKPEIPQSKLNIVSTQQKDSKASKPILANSAKKSSETHVAKDNSTESDSSSGEESGTEDSSESESEAVVIQLKSTKAILSPLPSNSHDKVLEKSGIDITTKNNKSESSSESDSGSGTDTDSTSESESESESEQGPPLKPITTPQVKDTNNKQLELSQAPKLDAPNGKHIAEQQVVSQATKRTFFPKVEAPQITLTEMAQLRNSQIRSKSKDSKLLTKGSLVDLKRLRTDDEESSSSESEASESEENSSGSDSSSSEDESMLIPTPKIPKLTKSAKKSNGKSDLFSLFKDL